jgi:hypothetical protein
MLFLRHLSQNVASGMRVKRCNADKKTNKNQKAEAGGACPLSRPAGKNSREAFRRPPMLAGGQRKDRP